MVAPAPTTLHVTEGCQGKADVHVVRSRAFQLTAEEARVALDLVTGMSLLLSSIFLLISLLIFVCCVLGSFLLKGISALILFDSGEILSFVSLTLSKMFVGAPGELNCPLEVEIRDDRSVRASRVRRDCVLDMFTERYSVDLVPIPLHKKNFIVGMDWLSPN